MITENS